MASLTVRDISSSVLSTLRARAVSSHRSLNGEILYILDWAAAHGTPCLSSLSGGVDPEVKRQKDLVESLIGSSTDSRSTREMADEIYAARTQGREVSL